MKKIVLWLLLIHSSIGFNQYLDSLYVSSGSTPNSIDVTTVVTHGSSFSYNNHTYSISNDTIQLDVCYNIGLMTVITTLSNTFELILPSGMGTWKLDVRINKSTSSNCFTNESVDSTFLEFEYPLVYDISLENMENHTGFLSVYPNPAQNQLTINSNGKIMESIQLYNILGEKVIENYSPNSQIDLTDVQNGIYFVVVKTSEGTLKKKIVIRK